MFFVERLLKRTQKLQTETKTSPASTDKLATDVMRCFAEGIGGALANAAPKEENKR